MATVTDRLPIAVHYPQEALPLSAASTSSANGGAKSATAARVIPTGSGYGPPLAQGGTPISRLVHSTLFVTAAEPTPAEAAQGWQASGSSKTEYDLVCLPLTNSNWQERWERMCTITKSLTEVDLGVDTLPDGSDPTRREAEAWRAGGGFGRTEVNLTRSEESHNVIAHLSDWLELDSPVEGIRFDSELALRQEIAYAAHLSIQTMLLPAPRLENREFVTDYARAVNGALLSSWHVNIGIRIPISSANAAEANQWWEVWDTIRQVCSYSPRLQLVLDLSGQLPSSENLAKWAAEPVKYLWLPCSTFIPNAKGYPVLSKAMQAFLMSLFKFTPVVVLSGTNRSLHASGGPMAYAQYIRYLHRKASGPNPVEQYAVGYLDHLQAPLQPLMDNLEGETYEGFEKDPIKYRQYEEAMFRALSDRPEKMTTVVFIVGAGRGPLVTACLRASERSRRTIKLTAVEKNPNAFVVLQERAATEWGNAVKIVFSDMRNFKPKEQADIIVSELLGSFGDNELSPECLDGVMRCLKPTGISIPCSYTSYLAPISTPKLHCDVTQPYPGTSSTVGDPRPAEQPYVVMFSQYHILSSAGGRHEAERIQECWGFDHPRPDVVVDKDGLPFTNHHNARSCHLTFHIPREGVCHGFAGYFEAVLYADIGLSIHPERAAGDMLSWFPIFFPLIDPIYLPAGSELDVQMWRMTDMSRRRVWFEWCASAYLWTSPSASHTHTTATNNGLSDSQAMATPRVGAPYDGGRRTVSGASSSAAPYSPMLDAFAPAPSPQIGGNSSYANGSHAHARDRDSGRMPGIEEHLALHGGAGPASPSRAVGAGATAGAAETRIRISMSKLHNPAGRTSYIGL